MNKPILLFDWDGVIVDSNAWKWGNAWKEVFATESDLFQIMKRVLEEDVTKKLSRVLLVEETIKRAADQGLSVQHKPEEYVERFGVSVREGVVRIGLFPDAKTVLSELHAEGYAMYVISMTTQRDLEYIAEQLDVAGYFRALYGVPGTKPEHAAKIQALESAEKYVVIGDGEGDKKLAEHLGVQFIGIANRWNGWKPNSDFLVIDSVAKLHEHL